MQKPNAPWRDEKNNNTKLSLIEIEKQDALALFVAQAQLLWCSTNPPEGEIYLFWLLPPQRSGSDTEQCWKEPLPCLRTVR